MPSLTQLEYAVAVDTHRHFGKAAKACHVSQPTLSTQLAKLEDELDCKLFDREKQPVIPTPEGERLLVQARVVVAELRRFEKLARKGQDDFAGSFRLGVIPTVSPYLVPLFLGAFRERYPNIELSIEEMQTETLLASLERESIDAGLLATPLEASVFDVRVLYDEPFYLYVPKSHPLAQRPYVNERDIPAEELWLLSDGHCLRGQVLQLCRVRPSGKEK
ncbi:MAG: LysR family transcriptional regulator, partial [Silvanigrellales bacterium]|nr:LysR family transcriptional regulator [Silvanigrellales bacterium]